MGYYKARQYKGTVKPINDLPDSVDLIGILPITGEWRPTAWRLAHRLDAKLIDCPPTQGLFLACGPKGLGLRLRTGRRELAVRSEFNTGRQAYRAGRASPRGEAIARACGLVRHGSRQVVDATAGLGGDAHILARLGARVTLVERSPIIFALLEDAVERAAQRPQISSWLTRIRLIAGDAAIWLQACPAQEQPSVVYLDPMYPRRATHAAPGKEMQVLQAVLGSAEEGSDALLQVARRSASERVVVKRPRRAEPLAGQPPDYQLVGRSTRFDVYRGTPE